MVLSILVNHDIFAGYLPCNCLLFHSLMQSLCHFFILLFLLLLLLFLVEDMAPCRGDEA